jgi:hypothetical protein
VREKHNPTHQSFNFNGTIEAIHGIFIDAAKNIIGPKN